MKKFISAFFILFCFNLSYSQEIEGSQIAVSIGYGQYDSELYGTGSALNVTGSYALNNYFARISGRVYNSTTFYDTDPGYGATTFAALFGQSYVHDFYKLSYSAGLGLIFGTTRRVLLPSNQYRISPIYKDTRFATFSIPFEFDISFFPTAANVGIGTTLFIDFNKERSMTGLIFKLDFGK